MNYNSKLIVTTHYFILQVLLNIQAALDAGRLNGQTVNETRSFFRFQEFLNNDELEAILGIK